MKIQEMDKYHGAALTQIVEHKCFKALNKADEKYGHYQVNHDRRLLAKYATKAKSPWQFTLNADDLRTINDDLRRKDGRTFLCLICGGTSVCLLDEGEIVEVLDLSQMKQQWVRVQIPPGGSMTVTGSRGQCRCKITHNSFPEKVFGSL